MPPEYNLTSDSDRESILPLEDIVVKPRRNSTRSKYCCSICNETFKRLDHLDHHEFKHTGIKKHACTYDGCDKVYSILTHLKRHLRTTHERKEAPVKSVECTIDDCDKMFQSVCNMQRHIREVHENPKIYYCPICNEKFTQKLKMRRHEISKHTRDYPFSCEKCSRGFYQAWQLDKHVPTCKIYPCTGCEKQFDKWSNYVKHCKESHHGRKYYKCEHCPRVYSKPGELKRHITVRHMDTELALNYKCSFENCERAYAYERNLRQHIKTVHSGKRFQCSEKNCERSFSSAQNLVKHVEREHVRRKRTKSSSSSDYEEKTTVDKNTKTKQLRKKRKDAGKQVVSNLAAIANISVERNFNKELCERDSTALDVVSAHLSEKMFKNTSEMESDEELTSEETNMVNKKSKYSTLNKHKEAQLQQLISLVLQE